MRHHAVFIGFGIGTSADSSYSFQHCRGDRAKISFDFVGLFGSKPLRFLLAKATEQSPIAYRVYRTVRCYDSNLLIFLLADAKLWLVTNSAEDEASRLTLPNFPAGIGFNCLNV